MRKKDFRAHRQPRWNLRGNFHCPIWWQPGSSISMFEVGLMALTQAAASGSVPRRAFQACVWILLVGVE